MHVRAELERVRAAQDGERVLNLEARFAPVACARVRRTGDERARTILCLVNSERVVNRDEDDGARTLARTRAERRSQARDLRAQLIDDARRADEVIRVGERVGMARAALQRVGEARAPAELSEVSAAPALIEKRAVVEFGKVVVGARGEVARAKRRAHVRDERREFGGLVSGIVGRGFRAARRERGRRGQRETRVRRDGNERA